MSKVIKAYKFSKSLSTWYFIASIYVLLMVLGVLVSVSVVMFNVGQFVFPISSALIIVPILVFIYQLSLVAKYDKISLAKRRRRVAFADFLSAIGTVASVPTIALVFMEVQRGDIDYSLVEGINQIFSYFCYPILVNVFLCIFVFPIVIAVKNKAYKKAGVQQAEEEIASYIGEINNKKADLKAAKQQQLVEKQNEAMHQRQLKLEEQERRKEEKQQQQQVVLAERQQKEEQRKQEKQQHQLDLQEKRQAKKEMLYNKVTSFNLLLWIVQFAMLVFYTLLLVSKSYIYDITYLILFAIVSWSLMIVTIVVNYTVRRYVKKMSVLMFLNVAFAVVLLISVLMVLGGSSSVSVSPDNTSRPSTNGNIATIVLYALYVVQLALAVVNIVNSAKNLSVKKNNPKFVDHDAEITEQVEENRRLNKERKQLEKLQKKDLAGLIALYSQKDKAYKSGNYSLAEDISKQIVAYQQEKGLSKASYFDGKLIQLIGYKLLGLLITAFTLGIAYPWALCMVKRWEVVHTVVDGRRLAFNGNGLQLFGKYILWMLLSVVTLGIYSFWLNINITKWVTYHTYDCSNAELDEYNKINDSLEQSVRNNNIDDISMYRAQLEEYKSVHGIAGRSKFDGGLLKLIGTNILSWLVTICTFGICLPWAMCIKYNFFVKHTIIMGKRQYFDGKALQLFGQWIKWLLLTIVTLGIYAFWLSISLKRWIVKHTHYVEVQGE